MQKVVEHVQELAENSLKTDVKDKLETTFCTYF